MKRLRRYTLRLHILVPRIMREDLDFVLRLDGRSLGEYVRSLIAQDLKAHREGDRLKVVHRAVQ